MDFPIDIRNRIELEAEKYKIYDLILTAKNVSENYLKNKGENIRFITNEKQAITYAIMRMPATFSSLYFSLNNLFSKIDGKITSVLDLGSGTGSSILAISTLLGEKIDFTCIEKEEAMLNLSKKFFSSNNLKYINKDIVKEGINEKADLLIASYFLNEVDRDNRFKILEEMIECSNKYIVIVEPGTPDDYKSMIEIRDYLIKKELNLIAPCPHMDKCPIENNDWCHFVTRVNRSKLEKTLKQADVPYEDEKFTYLIFSKTKEMGTNARILRHPYISKGVVKLQLCQKNGKVIERIVSKRNKDEYKAARKSSCGDEYIF